MFHGKISKEIARGLEVLRDRIDEAEIPPSILDESFNLATWNIREFGKKRRSKAAIHYIAEILYQFDFIAVTEFRRNVKDLRRVLDILGPYWKVVYSDYIADWGGNWERFAYIYDKRAVTFTGLASEVDGPRTKNKKTGEYVAKFSWWRKPFMASFRSGNFDFVAITAHVRWGDKKEDRIRPLTLLAEWIDERHNDKHSVDQDIILMGDFNIPKVGDKLYQAITSKGLKMPKALVGVKGTNLSLKNRYDQILHYPKYSTCFSDKGGHLDFYAQNHKKLFPRLSQDEFTYQLSDHLPLWIQVNTNTDEERLNQILNR